MEKEELLLKEYELLSSQYQHEDNLLETRNTIFTVVNLGLLGALRLVPELLAANAGAECPTITKWWPPTVCGFALIICLVWHLVTRAGRYYVELRLRQGAAIEREFTGTLSGVLQLFQVEHEVAYERKKTTSRNETYDPLSRLASLGHSAALYISVAFGLAWALLLVLFATGLISA
ncbi:MAG: hypothetical protein IH988_04010 [Planctomycetes bacterium]|nr:hypothetical protein [Planctomycetota bacterium]